MKQIIPIIIIAWFAYLAFTTSCANVGNPTGGPKDTIPPVLVETQPENLAINYDGSDIQLSFDEFITYSELSQKMLISPPMKKKPSLKSKGKTLIVEFNEDLKDSTTYSIDFRDAVLDNNEGNPYKDLRFAFSTGTAIDTLRIAGYVKNAFNLEPVEDALVVLYRDHNETAFYDSIPDYIGKTNEEGYFEIRNIAKGSYKLYAITDSDNSLTYNQSTEPIAFADSLIIPSAKFIPRNDTVIKGQDTLLLQGDVEYYPAKQYLMLFNEETFDQYIDSYKRTAANLCIISFEETLTDSFQMNLLKPKIENKDWFFIESNKANDSLTFWITDTLLSKVDTLIFDVKYLVKDSLDQLVVKHDTLDFLYVKQKKKGDKRAQRRRKKEKENEKKEIPQISLSHNIKPTGHDIFQKIEFETPEPLESFDTSMVRLFHFIDDSTKEEIPIKVEPDSTSSRCFSVNYKWEPEESYLFSIDSAAAKNIYGYPSKKIEQKFTIQEERYYGTIILNLQNLKSPAVIQLLSADEKETIIQKIQVLEDGKITFPYLKPEKYIIKAIFDTNKNGKWDTGYLTKKIQPERVIYYPKVLKIKSNFEFQEAWRLELDPKYEKNVIDEDEEKEKGKGTQKGKHSEHHH